MAHISTQKKVPLQEAKSLGLCVLCRDFQALSIARIIFVGPVDGEACDAKYVKIDTFEFSRFWRQNYLREHSSAYRVTVKAQIYGENISLSFESLHSSICRTVAEISSKDHNWSVYGHLTDPLSGIPLSFLHITSDRAEILHFRVILFGLSSEIIKRVCQKFTHVIDARSSHGPSLNS